MLNIFVNGLAVHTTFFPISCLLYRVLQIEGEVSGDSVLVHLGRVVGWVHLWIRLDISKGGVTRSGNRDLYTTLLLSSAIWTTPLTSIRGGVLEYDDWIFGS